MPRVDFDPLLQSSVQALIDRDGGTVAANLLGFNRSSLCRFAKSGKAIPKTKTKLKEGLAKLETAQKTAQNVTDNKEHLSNSLSVQELKKMRHLLTCMLTIVDSYERQMTSTESCADKSVLATLTEAREIVAQVPLQEVRYGHR